MPPFTRTSPGLPPLTLLLPACLSQDREYWRILPTPPHPSAACLLQDREYWRILDCAEDFSYALFYYSGAAAAAGRLCQRAALCVPAWPCSLPGSLPTAHDLAAHACPTEVRCWPPPTPHPTPTAHIMAAHLTTPSPPAPLLCRRHHRHVLQWCGAGHP